MIDQEKFTELKTKYNISQENNLSNSNFLYLILSKADIDISFLNEIDWAWLLHNFTETYEILEKKKEIEEENINLLAYEKFKAIYNKYSSIFASTPVELLGFNHSSYYLSYAIKAITSELLSILSKIDTDNNLSQANIDHLKTQSLNEDEFKKLLDFLELKRSYNIIDNTSVLPYIDLYNLLKKIENKQPLTHEEELLINEHKILENVLKKYNSQQQKYAQEFSELKDKYYCSQHEDNSFKSKLYEILKNIDSGQILTKNERDWLEQNKLQDTLEVVKFLDLKIKYNVIDNEDLSFKSNFYKVLIKIDSNVPLQDQDINFLKRRNLLNLINTANQKYANYLINEMATGIELNQIQSEWTEKNPEFDVITLGRIKDFERLRDKYEVLTNDQSSDFDNQLFWILKKIEKGELLKPTERLYLEDKKLFNPNTKIYINYYIIEAKSYEEDYKKTKDKWNIPNISSAWRKANEPEKALKITENIKLEKIKDKKLKSAILTTKGASFRDIFHSNWDNSLLNESEKCATEAINFQPLKHHPYTLMGAICYDRYDYTNGDQWFVKAIERGASDKSIDSEIKKSITRMRDKEKRRQVAEDLLKRDSEKYSWAKQYLNPPKQKKRKK